MELKTLENLSEILASVPSGYNLEVEIGCGNGHFISEYCMKNRSSYMIGLEVKTKRCMKAAAKIKKRKLHNASIIQAKAEEFLKIIPEARVDRYHIYFPDPWPKTRHRKRRFLRILNLNLLYRSLKKEGVIFFTTDFFDYYLQTKMLFLLHPGLKLSEEWPPEEIFVSIYSEKFKHLGMDIHITAAKKT